MMRASSLSWLLSALACLAASGVLPLAASPAHAQDAGVIGVRGEWITLGDVAPVSGDHAGILLGPAPPPGQTLALDPAFLVATAKAAGVILAIPLDRPVMVTRAAGGAARQARPATRAPVANPALQVSGSPGGSQGTQAEAVEVLVLLRDVARGSVLSADDLGWQPAASGRPLRNGADMDMAIGREVRRALKAGQPVLASDLRAPAVIRKGQQVKIVYATPGVRLTVDGLAQNDAAAGEAVRVLNTLSKRTIEATATAAGEASVTSR